ncbi:hypothetical protein [Sphingomonas alpina]|uniref:Uncharacterized protein n=1 Tax=Sphingomonas alpina TaxID=653931 RepID=A0A7H0LF86_9SPHN|nr:hypothetical protein [Sphingomonas alpina]QNQ08339.1 hypothetical protein H3Z74_16500 [Sphingomonas alpina]
MARKSSTTAFDIEVSIKGNTVLSRRTVTGYDDNKGYFKAGCYVPAAARAALRRSAS